MIQVSESLIHKVINSTPFPEGEGVRAYQVDAVLRACRSDGLGVLFEQGTGKTLTLILIVRLLFYHFYELHNRLPNILVLGPIDVKENWVREITKYAQSSLYETVTKVSGNPSRRRRSLTNPKKRIFVCNYETIITQSFQEILERPWDAIICDEFHKCKHRGSERSKRLIRLKKANPQAYLYALTGTPILNTPLDSYMLLHFLGAYKGGITSFKLEYFYDANAGIKDRLPFPNWKLRPDKVEALQKLIDSCCVRVKTSDAVDLPPLIKQDVYVELTDEQRRIYKQLSRDFVAECGDGHIVADLAITKTLRLQQLCSGVATVTQVKLGVETTNHLGVACNKYRALEDLLENILAEPNNKVIIWSYWVATYPLIQQILFDAGVKYVTRTGAESEKQKQEAVDAFQRDPETRVLLGNQSMGIGINLTAANYAIWFSKPWNLEHQLQSAARNYRLGSGYHKTITHINLITANTIEEDIEAALQLKKSSAELLLDIRNRLKGPVNALPSDE